MNLHDLILQVEGLGYNNEDAVARVCQDIVLKGIAKSTLSRNVTIKGGVVMRSITGNIRRATQDMDIAFDDEGASLLINSKEQMVAEKLRSLLKFGRFSTRFKDIFDIYYHCDKINNKAFLVCMDSFVFNDLKMHENNMADVYKRLSKIFQDKSFKRTVDKSDKRWLDDDIDVIFDRILEFVISVN